MYEYMKTTSKDPMLIKVKVVIDSNCSKASIERAAMIRTNAIGMTINATSIWHSDAQINILINDVM